MVSLRIRLRGDCCSSIIIHKTNTNNIHTYQRSSVVHGDHLAALGIRFAIAGLGLRNNNEPMNVIMIPNNESKQNEKKQTKR